jgi:hypothetical protein
MSTGDDTAHAGFGEAVADSMGAPLKDMENGRLCDRIPAASAHLIRITEAARITGLPPSTLRKSFMREEKRPRNIPAPPPHKRIGRAVYIIARELPAWIENLGGASTGTDAEGRRGRGRPSVAERIRRRAD